jgi:hypothetical protein
MIKQSSYHIKAIVSIIDDPSWEESLTEAESFPNGKMAKKLHGLFNPHIITSGRHLPFTKASQTSSLSRMIAMIRHFGPPSHFVTVAPSDLDCPMIISLAKPVDVNASVVIPLDGWSLAERSQIVADDPTSTAFVFHRIMEKMFTSLIQMAPESRIRGERPEIGIRKPGIYGKPVGYYGVYECQGRVSISF